MTPVETASMIALEAMHLAEKVREHEEGESSSCMRKGIVGLGSTATAIEESCRKLRSELLDLGKMIGGE